MERSRHQQVHSAATERISSAYPGFGPYNLAYPGHVGFQAQPPSLPGSSIEALREEISLCMKQASDDMDRRLEQQRLVTAQQLAQLQASLDTEHYR